MQGGRIGFWLSLVLGTVWQISPAPDATATPDPFVCHPVIDGARPVNAKISLADQFGPDDNEAIKVTTLCAPGDLRGKPATNKSAHLACYAMARQLPPPRKRVALTNTIEQGGVYVVAAPSRLCVPAGKAPVGGTTLPPVGLSAFRCFTIRRTSRLRPRPLAISDQFGQTKLSATRGLLLCAPAILGESRPVDSRTHLACYGRVAGPQPAFKVLIADIFEPPAGPNSSALALDRPNMVCVPTRKRLL